MFRSVASISILSLTMHFSIHAQTNWKIADNYEIAFSGKKAEGTFKGLEGTIQFDPNDLENSRFEVSVDVSTIETGNKTKNNHAKGDSWFFSEKFPEIFFTSSTISTTANGYEVTGTLDLHGIKKTITFPFTFSENGDSGQLNGKMTVNRQDFGIEGNFFGFAVGDDFSVTLKVPVWK